MVTIITMLDKQVCKIIRLQDHMRKFVEVIRYDDLVNQSVLTMHVNETTNEIEFVLTDDQGHTMKNRMNSVVGVCTYEKLRQFFGFVSDTKKKV